MVKKSTAPAQAATQEDDEELPQTAVKPRAKELMIQQLAQLAEKKDEAPASPPANEAPSGTSDEETWKKRYGDLRRHAQTEENTLKSTVSGLQAQIEQLKQAAQERSMPKSREEFEAWKEKFPDVVPFIEMIADEKASMSRKQVSEELEQVKEKLAQAERDRNWATLKVLVPDVEAIYNSGEFKGWLSAQPEFVSAELNTSEDPHRIAYWMNIFKMATQKPVKSERKAEDKLRALDASIKGTGINPSPNADKYKYTTTQISKMSTADFEKNEADIIAARNAGQILDDMARKQTVFDM